MRSESHGWQCEDFRRIFANITVYRLKSYCEQVGFWKEKEVSFPHKQSNLMKIRRDSWEQPAL
jgi:hypothetical protein